MKKLLMLILPALLLAGCSVKDKELEITVFNNPMNAVYTGKVKRKLPEGTGTALIGTNAKAEGTFEKGVFVSGEAEQIPYSTMFNDQTFSGIYGGEVSDQLPEGTGTFTSDEFSFEGVWTDGLPDGAGTITAPLFRISTKDGTLEGSYTGEVSQGNAEGKGTFVYQDDGDEIKMEGSFSGSQFDGLLVKTISYPNTVKSYPVYYQSGEPVHNAASMIAYLEGMRNESYCLSEAQLSFIAGQSDLFDGGKAGQDLSEKCDSSFDYDSFQADRTPALIRIPDAVIKSIQRYKPYEGADTVTSMIVQNQSGWYHLVFAYTVESADKGDTVDLYALPLSRSTLTAPEQDYEAIDAAGASVIRKW